MVIFAWPFGLEPLTMNYTILKLSFMDFVTLQMCFFHMHMCESRGFWFVLNVWHIWHRPRGPGQKFPNLDSRFIEMLQTKNGNKWPCSFQSNNMYLKLDLFHFRFQAYITLILWNNLIANNVNVLKSKKKTARFLYECLSLIK